MQSCDLNVLFSLEAMLPEGANSTHPPLEVVRASLEHVLAAPSFGSKRRSALLRYLVERTLAGQGEALSEYSIALDVFRKPESFDPRSESTVRAEMSRLRKTLAEYYENGGAGDLCRVEFPARGYAPSFVWANLAKTEPPPRPSPRHWRRWVSAAGLLLLVSGAGILWRLRSAPPLVRSVIVLPFVNLTGDPANDYLTDGLTEGLTDALAHVASLRVVARTSAFQFKGKAADIREIGRKVNADAAVEGSLRKTETGLMVTVQVNRTADGYHVLSRVFDGGPREEGRIQADMVLPVLAALRPGVIPPGGRTPDPEAFDLVLRARALRGYGLPDKFNRQVGLLNQAIQKDPEYAGAYAELASAYAGAATNAFLDPLGAAVQVKAAAAQAIALDPTSATAYAAEGYVNAMVLANWKLGEDEIRSALRLQPQSASLHQRLGLVLLVQGHFQPALAEVRAAAVLDPLVPATGSSIGMVYFMQRRYSEALTEWRNLAALHPDAIALRSLVGMALEAKGDYSQAETEYAALAVQDPHDSQLRMMHLLAVCGRRQEARKLLETIDPTGPGDALDFAATYGALGDRDQAFVWIARAWEHRSSWMLKVHPFLDPLRGDPRYAGFLKLAGFVL
ncbi:MAG: hypothetical protein LAP40_13015 [Acidobacteriia bacterium]|nr:hypothetical protein [Terriglobia bacterium]